MYIRNNIKELLPYSTARDDYKGGDISVWLDANESPYNNGVNRYPDPHQKALKGEIAQLKGVTPEQVFVGNGSDEAIDLCFRIFCEPGVDNVVAIAPTYGMYAVAAAINNVAVREVPLEAETYALNVPAMLAAADANTRLMWVCSPNNPTGCILNTASLDAVARVAEEAGIYVVCDDVYNRLVYVDGYERFAQRHPELREQTVVIESFSKPWAMTGWRLGWLAAAAPVIAEIAKAHQYLVSSAVSFEMDAAARALTVDPTPMLEVYRARRERVLAALDAMGLDVVEPAGAFYTFPSIKKFGLTSEDFCIKAIKEANVALVPGDCFGTEGHIRLSYCVSDKDLDEGLTRLSAFISTL